jgi:hypothetical protein
MNDFMHEMGDAFWRRFGLSEVLGKGALNCTFFASVSAKPVSEALVLWLRLYMMHFFCTCIFFGRFSMEADGSQFWSSLEI